ncbi:hypothetical protein [Paenibacillus sp. NEAU-GSW1]|uniref:hypothetical protein n=1 Tax=Paenibacillus sp. NEAU-GSW1 TaxID=2682486 RepID=UPI0012E19EBA|nr:hypothetical protein [Paenibacillus sp. NEAU-GSW1]MUT65184.1 hypothetical protein [Paenibacillus sp. NEAU-GSW1]
MQLSKRTIGIGIVLICVAVGVLIGVRGYSATINKLYGNDEASIAEVIMSIDGYKGKTIEILGITDLNDEYRVAAFLSDSKPAYIQFSKNKAGNYEWIHIETQDTSLAIFSPSAPFDDKPKFLIVTSRDNDIAKMQVEVNGELVEQKIEPIKAAAVWMDLPETSEKSYTFSHYRYYDADGNLVEA